MVQVLLEEELHDFGLAFEEVTLQDLTLDVSEAASTMGFLHISTPPLICVGEGYFDVSFTRESYDSSDSSCDC